MVSKLLGRGLDHFGGCGGLASAVLAHELADTVDATAECGNTEGDEQGLGLGSDFDCGLSDFHFHDWFLSVWLGISIIGLVKIAIKYELCVFFV